MARHDIRVGIYPGDGRPLMQDFRLNAGETFLVGEPVSQNADGELTESADDPVDADLLGIAGSDGDTTNAGGLSTLRNRFGQFTDTRVVSTGDMIPVVIPDGLILFRTANFSSGGAAFGDVAPAAANVGDEVGLSLIGGSWGVDISATNNIGRIVDVLETTLGISLQMKTPAATRTSRVVIFSINASQQNSFGTVDAPVA